MFSYTFKLLYKLSHNSSVNIQGYIFVSAVSLYCKCEAIFFGFPNKFMFLALLPICFLLIKSEVKQKIEK